jgi:hypothetical protein
VTNPMVALVMMLLIGLFASVWGFLMCFFPARWDRLTEAMSFAGRWTEPSPERQHPLIRLVVRLGECIGGLAVCAVGCWFAYLASSGIYHVLTGRATTHTLPPTSGTLPNTPAPAATALTVFMIVAGILMAVFPGKAMAVFERVWPRGRRVTRTAAPKVMLVVRLCGLFFAFLAAMSLIH